MSRLSCKNQVTIPVAAMRDAGLSPGDQVRIRVSGPGRLELERVEDLVERWAGSLPPGTYPDRYIEKLRDEWE